MNIKKFCKSYLSSFMFTANSIANCTHVYTIGAYDLASGKLPATEDWHIYLLNANWGQDVYELHPNDFRISHTAKVLKLVKKSC
jgi:hypothetical protein